MQVTSKNNSKIKLIRSLHQRKYRQQSGLFLVEGLHGVLEALNHPERVEMVVAAYDLLKSERGCTALNHLPSSIPLIETSADVFSNIASRDNPQGIMAVVRQQWTALHKIHPQDGVWVALCDVQYPGNLGTILRTCDAVGAEGVIILGNATDPYHPTAVHAGLSAYFTQKIVHAEFAEFALWARQGQYKVIGASADGAVNYRRATYPLPLILMMGSEGHGLGQAQRDLCDALVAIPMYGQNDSLNLAVATGVLLYEILAQV